MFVKSSRLLLPVIFSGAIVSLWYQQQGDTLLIYYTDNDITFTTTSSTAGNNNRRTAEEVQQERQQPQPQKQAAPPSLQKLRRDEFVQKKLSNEEIDQYFYFDIDQMNEKLGNTSGQRREPLVLQPLGGRKCFPTTTMMLVANNNNNTNSSIISRELELHHTNNNNNNKLVFLHIWRSAGSTIRALLRAYSYYCQNGFATVTKCIDLGSEYMHDNKDVWASGKANRKVRHDCVLRSALDRQRQIINKTKVSKSFLQKYNIDILAGHIPLGCGEVWKQQPPQQMPKVQYVVFLRDPVHQFVSSLLFEYKSRIAARKAAGNYQQDDNDILTIDDGYNIINSTVHNMTQDNIYYLQTTNQLITPDQKSYVYNENILWTYERRVNLTLSNLMNYNVVVGIVERMPESIQMLQYVLVDGGGGDGGGADNEISGLFNYFATAAASSSSNNSSNNRLISNYMQTKNQTDTIVNNLIRHDPELMSMLNERLKYEKQIYEWGLRIHKRQYESINNNNNNNNKKSVSK